MLLFYAAQKNRAVEDLETILRDQLPAHKILHCTTMEALEGCLRRPCRELEIVLIFICDAIEMATLSALKPMLLDLRLLLVLPRRDADTVAWAHTLGPRFIAYADNGVDPIAAVLTKMLSASRVNVVFLDKERLVGVPD
jgi:hypothetical protein